MEKIQKQKRSVFMNTGLLPGLFSGTYYTEWEPKEYSDSGEEQELEYSHNDLMQSIAEEYAAHDEYILNEIQEFAPFVKKIKFRGTSYSPREYNFSTDVLDFDIVVNRKEMIAKAKEILSDPKYAEFLHEHYSSRDGFMSFTPDNPSRILWQLEDKGDEYEQSIAALINYLAEDAPCNVSDGGIFRDIEEHIFDHWRGNGYGGLDYSVIEPEPEAESEATVLFRLLRLPE